jgi:hypothetical protein
MDGIVLTHFTHIAQLAATTSCVNPVLHVTVLRAKTSYVEMATAQRPSSKRFTGDCSAKKRWLILKNPHPRLPPGS